MISSASAQGTDAEDDGDAAEDDDDDDPVTSPDMAELGADDVVISTESVGVSCR